MEDWCLPLIDSFESLSDDAIVVATDYVLSQVSTAFHKVTQPVHQNESKLARRLRKALSSLPPAGSPSYSAALKQVQEMLKGFREREASSISKKLHRSMVQGVRIKRTLDEVLDQERQPPSSLRTAAGDRKSVV